MNTSMEEVWTLILRLLEQPLITLGPASVTALGIGKLLALVGLVIIGEHLIRRYVFMRVLRRTRLNPSMQLAMSKVGGYLFVALGLYIALKAVGIDLSSLAVVAGALGVGLGFGLQTIISNFVSGIIILAERPIQIGDRIEVGEIAGEVREINLRATTVVTNDNISIIVPNSHFVSETVTNWSHGDPRVQIRVPVGVAYGSDIDKVKHALLEVAKTNPKVLTDPAPTVFFDGFGDSSLNFELGVWTAEMISAPRRFRSEINYAIDAAFRKYDIQIPFPQRDLHLRSGNVVIRPGPGDGKSLDVTG